MLPTLADRLANTAFPDPGQQRKHVFHDQRWPTGVQRKGAREIGRIQLTPALLWRLATIVKKARCVDDESQLAFLGGEYGGTFQARFVQQVD